MPVSWKNLQISLFTALSRPSFSNNKSLTGFAEFRHTFQGPMFASFQQWHATWGTQHNTLCHTQNSATHIVPYVTVCFWLSLLVFLFSGQGPLGQRAWLASAAAMAGVLWCRQLHCIAIFVLLLGHLSQTQGWGALNYLSLVSYASCMLCQDLSNSPTIFSSV